MNDAVVLAVGGKRYEGWLTVRLSRSLDKLAHGFSLQVTNKWTDASQPIVIRPGLSCDVSVGSARIITGYVDNVSASYAGDQQTLQVSGRSKAADLIDCSLEGQQFLGQSVYDIAVAVFKPFGISVQSAIVDSLPVIRDVSLAMGDSPYDFVAKLAASAGARFVSLPDGNVALVKTGVAVASDSLTLGENILSANASFSAVDRYSHYIAIGQDGAAFGTAVSNAHVRHEEKDSWVGSRYRPRVFEVTGKADAGACQKRSLWERNTAFGRSQTVTYSVAGWRQQNGALWDVNQLVRVNDSHLGIKRDMLIADCNFMLDAQGQRTELRVVPPEAYNILAAPLADDSPIF